MDAKRRWTVLLCALAATVAAIAYPVEEESGDIAIVVPVGLHRPAPPKTVETVVANEVAWIASDEDPFMARHWQAPAPPPPPEPAKPSPVAEPVAPPPPPTPLPYKFVGQMNNEGARTVYLARGDQVLLAHQGDVLDGSYKVVAIRTAQIEFEALASGLKQTLAIPVQEN